MSQPFSGVDQLSPEQLEQLILRLKPAAPQVASIPAQPRDGGPLPLSASQERLWFLDRLEGASSAYTITAAVELRGPLVPRALEQALGGLVARHESLRTVFVEGEDDHPQQHLLEPFAVHLPLHDLSALPDELAVGRASSLAADLIRRPFDLAQGPLLRTALLRLADDRHQLILELHHIVSDAWSMGVVVRELGLLYRAAVDGATADLPPLPIQYADYAVWERQQASSDTLAEQLESWCRDLAGAPVVELPGDRPRPPVRSNRGDQTPLAVDPDTVTALRQLAERQGTTLFVVVASLFATFLRRHGAGTDLVLGTPVANRRRSEVEGLIGFFVNTLALRIDLAGVQRFDQLVGEMAEVSSSGLDRQEVAFERLVDRLVPQRSLSHPPLVQVMLALDEAPPPTALPGLEGTLATTIHDLPSGTAKLDLLLQLRPTAEGGLVGWLESSRDLFDPTTAQRMTRRLVHLAGEVAQRPRARLDTLSGLAPVERHQLQHGWNDLPGVGASQVETLGGTLDGLFRASALRNPEAVALAWRDQRWTYAELSERSAALGRQLAARGVGAESLVAIRMQRTPAVVAAILGVLRAGGAYVPIDPAYPETRQRILLEDSGARLLVVDAPVVDGAVAGTDGSTAEQLADGLPVDILRLDGEGRVEDTAGDQPPSSTSVTHPQRALADNLAYLIYTSGSTGRPKAVAIAHRAALALVAWSERVYSASEMARVAATTSLCFDLSIFELFATFHRGGTVVLLRNALELAEPDADRPPVTLINTVPSAMATLAAQDALPPEVTTVNLAGEPLRATLADQVYATGVGRVLDLYGPSEDTTYSTWAPVERRPQDRGTGGEPTIGRPVDGGRALVLDPRLHRVPAGVPGEVVLGGVGLARGYLGRPAATAERFIPDPWGDGERLYRTGDLGRALADGRLEYLGRRDQQVKVRGFRIELGEVETALGALDTVAEASVVVVGQEAANRRLVAFAVASPSAAGPDTEVDTAVLDTGVWSEAVRGALLERLPKPLVPSELFRVEALPLTPNGKVDRRELERRAIAGAGDGVREAAYVAPQGPLETLLADRLATLLDTERSIGVDDDFFALGGHSLLAARLASQLTRQLDREVPVQWIFEAPTVARLARRLSDTSRRALPPLVAGPRPEHPPLSPAQERLWFLDRLEGSSPVYHLPVAIDLEGPLDSAALEGALVALLGRHEVLRTRFVEITPGTPSQRVEPAPTTPLPRVDLSALPAEQRRVQQTSLEAFWARHPFDLAWDLPLRAVLLHHTEGEATLLLVAHHIAVDGGSLPVLFDELSALYTAARELPSPSTRRPALEPPALQVVDHALWQRRWLDAETTEPWRADARRQLAETPAALDLPFDRPASDAAALRGETLPLPVADTAGARLAAVARQLGATPFMVLLAALDSVLFRWTGQGDLLVGTPVANRERPEVERAIGLYANTLVTRTAVEGDLPFATVVERARHATLDAYGLRELPFEALVQEVVDQRDLDRSPLFQVFLVLQEAWPSVELQGLDSTLRPLDTGTARFELTLSAVVRGTALDAAIEVSGRFEAPTRRRLAAQLARLLDAALADPETLVADLPLLSPAERHQLEVEWQGAALPTASDDTTLWSLFAEQAAATPEAAALVADDGTVWTYARLEASARRVASALLARDAVTGDAPVVAVAAERRPETVAALLGVLATGAAYLPLDPAYPHDRLRLMLGDSGARWALCDDALAALCDEVGVQTLPLEPPATETLSPQTLPRSTARQLAYLIYTSGSTGRPKAVAIEHRSATALVRWSRRVFSDADLAGVLASTSLCFDLSIFELFVPLTRGGTVVLVRDALALAELPPDTGVTLINTVPSALAALLRVGPLAPSIRVVNLAGEPLRRDLVRQLRQSEGDAPRVERVYNLYGPSEDTTYTTVADVPLDTDAEPTLGRPVDGTRARLVDRALHPVPIGGVGEIVLAGEGLARGYLGRAAATAERFLPDPLAETAGDRLYRTGDLGRHRTDGEIEFLGRVDHQVKIRGHRVELPEIEATLHDQPAVDEAAVLALPGPDGEPQLVAFVGARGGVPGGGSALRRALGESLPAAMVPSRTVVVEVLPHTPNGKIDRRALPPLMQAETTDDVEAMRRPARDGLEQQLLALFETTLDVASLGIDEDFFVHGGHSLLAVRLLGELQQALSVELPVRTLFEHPTVERLAEAVRAASPVRDLDTGPRRGQAGARPPLSVIQERLWFLDRFEGGSAALAMPLALDLVGRLDPQALRRALAAVLRRHRILRTTLPSVDGTPYQQVMPRLTVTLPVVDLRRVDASRREAIARAALDHGVAAPFDLAQGPLFRGFLAVLDDDRHRLVLIAHHAIFDGWSAAVLLRELAAFYRLEVGDGVPSEDLPPLDFDYADFAAWQRRPDADHAAALDFYRQQLEGAPKALELPADRPRRGGRFHAHRHHRVLDPATWIALQQLAARSQATPFLVLEAALAAVLARWSGQSDVVLGSPLADRDQPSLEGLIGPMLNTLVVRLEVAEETSFETLLAQARERFLAAHQHRALPFETLLSELGVERDLDRTPLFQVFVNLLSFPRPELDLPGLEVEGVTPPTPPAKFDLTLYARPRSDDRFELDLVSDARLFDPATGEALIDQLVRMLEAVVETPDRAVRTIPLAALDDPRRPDPQAPLSNAFHGALPDLLAQRARETPRAVAVVEDGGETWTYGELESVVERLAAALQARGVEPGDRVVLYAHRNAALVASLLAVLRSGGVFVVVDPASPEARLVAACERVTPRALLAFEAAGALPAALVEALETGGVEQLPVPTTLSGLLAQFPEATPTPIALDADSPAYIALTSGSTGRPKGVVGRHGSLTHFTQWMAERFGLSANDRFSVLSALAHDPLHRDVFTPLQLGASIEIPAAEHFAEPGYLARWMTRRGVTVCHGTPSLVRLLSEDAEGIETGLRRAFLVGEALTREHVRRLVALAPGVQVVNLYGSTETQRAVGYHEVPPLEGFDQEVLPLGRGVEDVQLLVRGPTGVTAVGELGEIWVRSPHVALGYLDDAEANRRFVVNPDGTDFTDRLYRTGDLGRYRADGEVVFAGRADRQVKIRGHRIELEEIEALLEALPTVRDAAVVLWPAEDEAEGAGEPWLAAYVVLAPGVELDPDALRREAEARLTAAQRPAVYEILDALPLSANRKIDRAALPRPQRFVQGTATEAPRGSVETRLAALWSEVLRVPEIERTSHFFHLGGHSLALTQLASRIRRELGIEVPLRTLFEAPTLAQQAEQIGALETTAGGPQSGQTLPALERRPLDGPAPLSYAQHRLWFLDQLTPNSAAFNLAFGFRLVGQLEVAALDAAFHGLVRRHPALRTRLPVVDGQPRQVVEPASHRPLPVVDLTALPNALAEAEERRQLERVARQPFDLAQGPLTRTVLVRRRADEHALAVVLHHVITDGWSNGVLVRELAELYHAAVDRRSPRLPTTPVDYTDFALWQRGWLAGERLDRELDFWRRHLADWPQQLDLPTDRPRPAEASARGATLPVTLPKVDLSEVLGLARDRQTTLFPVLLAAFKVLLHHLSGARRMLVGTDVANRRVEELEGVVGFFVNQLVIPGDLDDDPTFATLVERVHTAAVAAYAHQDVPFDRVVDALGVERRLDRSPLFQVKLIVQNAPFEPLQLPAVELRPMALEKGTAQQDLVLALWQRDERLEGWINYSTDLFEAATVRRFLTQLESILIAAVRNPNARLEELRQSLVDHDRRARAMSETKTKKPSLAAFKKNRSKESRPAAVAGATESLVKRSQPFDDVLPLVLEPTSPEVDLLAWLAAHQETVAKDLRTHGAVFFRGFGVTDPQDFERFANTVCSSLFDENGEHPHESVSGNVYTPVFYSPAKKLLWHNENSFNFRWPTKIMFCSARPADSGGETPLADSRRVYDRIDPTIRRRFEELGVRYQRNYGQGMGLDWKEVFQTENRADVEAYCRENHFEYQWRDDGGLRTLCRRPAVVQHPVTGEKTWFNQAQHWHPGCLDDATRESLTYLFSNEDMPRNCTFGDGTPIPDEAMHHILDVYREVEVALPWGRGDIMLVDNLLAAHARNPYEGERKLLVAMGDMASYDQVAA